jgi:hypothetical protein
VYCVSESIHRIVKATMWLAIAGRQRPPPADTCLALGQHGRPRASLLTTSLEYCAPTRTYMTHLRPTSCLATPSDTSHSRVHLDNACRQGLSRGSPSFEFRRGTPDPSRPFIYAYRTAGRLPVPLYLAGPVRVWACPSTSPYRFMSSSSIQLARDLPSHDRSAPSTPTSLHRCPVS